MYYAYISFLLQNHKIYYIMFVYGLCIKFFHWIKLKHFFINQFYIFFVNFIFTFLRLIFLFVLFYIYICSSLFIMNQIFLTTYICAIYIYDFKTDTHAYTTTSELRLSFRMEKFIFWYYFTTPTVKHRTRVLLNEYIYMLHSLSNIYTQVNNWFLYSYIIL